VRQTDTSVSSTTYSIPLHRTLFERCDADALVQALDSGLMTGDGVANAALAQMARRTLGAAHAFPTPSGTHALELMFRALPLRPGDEVICPSFTFVSAANAILLAGGRPVFADVDPDTLNLDASDASARVGSRTRAMLTAHYAGVGSQLHELQALAESHSLDVLEDAAHALGGRFDGRPLGTWGKAGAFSFHGTKNIVSGEGGLLVINDTEMAARAEVIREKGTDRSRFVRGEVDRYTWHEIGSSFLMSDLLAALVASQWKRLDAVTMARRACVERYQLAFEPLAAAGLVKRPVVPPDCEPACHIYYLLADEAETRSGLITFLRQRGIEASSHFVPLHLSPFARQHLGTLPGSLPMTERIADRLLRLPLYPSLSRSDQHAVIDAVFSFFGRRS
jgi:TDP-4-keto-6-deoxy-D-glucose transaminase